MLSDVIYSKSILRFWASRNGAIGPISIEKKKLLPILFLLFDKILTLWTLPAVSFLFSSKHFCNIIPASQKINRKCFHFWKNYFEMVISENFTESILSVVQTSVRYFFIFIAFIYLFIFLINILKCNLKYTMKLALLFQNKLKF